MKLLAIKIVANSLFGRRSNSSTLSFALLFFDLSSSTSAGSSEKNAVSEPDIKPEAKSKIIKIKNVNISAKGTPSEKLVIKTNKGSGRGSGSILSKIYYLIQQIIGKNNIKMANRPLYLHQPLLIELLV